MDAKRRQTFDILEDIRTNAHKYDLHQLVYILQQLATGSELCAFTGKKIDIRADKNLSFPASDVRGISEQADVILVTARLLGLYGVDSPLPHYFLEEVVEDRPSSARFQAFLDIFNRRVYQLLQDAWQRTQFLKPMQGRLSLNDMIGALMGSQSQNDQRYAGSFGPKHRSANALEPMLKEALQLPELSIDTQAIKWVEVDALFTLDGQQQLGIDTMLGSAAPVIGQNLKIETGAIDKQHAVALTPENDLGSRMAELLQSYLPKGVEFDIHIKVQEEAYEPWQLASHASRLAIDTQLGRQLSEHHINMNSAQYWANRSATHITSLQ